jgi:hypothetical protein
VYPPCPQDTPAYEVLYQENSIINQKLVEKRAQQEAERSKQCTFTPHLVSAQLVKEGRVMKVGGGGRRCQSVQAEVCTLVIIQYAAVAVYMWA